MKTCSVCNTPKGLEEFDKKKSGSVSGYCKECRREKLRKHYEDNKDSYKKKARKNSVGYISRFERYKRSLSCEDCKLSFENEPYLCDFHHIDKDNKEFNIAHIRGHSFEKIMKEIEKCVPLCSNCHRRRHALLAKLDKAPEYESGDSEGSTPSQSTFSPYKLSIEQIFKALEEQRKYWS